jgi:hypothetical protein
MKSGALLLAASALAAPAGAAELEAGREKAAPARLPRAGTAFSTTPDAPNLAGQPACTSRRSCARIAAASARMRVMSLMAKR